MLVGRADSTSSHEDMRGSNSQFALWSQRSMPIKSPSRTPGTANAAVGTNRCRSLEESLAHASPNFFETNRREHST